MHSLEGGKRTNLVSCYDKHHLYQAKRAPGKGGSGRAAIGVEPNHNVILKVLGRSSNTISTFWDFLGL